jgi:RNA polymerase sigma factor (sigma-70 family)
MPEAQLREFELLMADLAAGSEEAAWQLTERYTPHIIRAVRATLPSKLRRLVDSQDFAQAVWTSLLLKRVELGRIDSEQALIGYLARTAKNKVVDACRKYLDSKKRDLNRDRTITAIQTARTTDGRDARPGSGDHEPFAHSDTPSECAILRERWHAVLAAESERNRMVLEYRLKGISFAKIAAELKIHEGTARRVVLRIISKLDQ